MKAVVMLNVGKYGIRETKREAKRKHPVLMIIFLVMLSFLFVLSGKTAAEAVPAAPGLPWESHLDKLADSLVGPVARALCLIMIVVSVGVLVFGGDLSGWARSITFMTLAAGILGSAVNFINLFFASGALM